MKLSEVLSIVHIFLLCTVGIGCLELKLDEFYFMCSYFNQVRCNANAVAYYHGRGTMVLSKGEELPQYIMFEEKCPPSTECMTRSGEGTWRPDHAIPTMYCQSNFTEYIFGCHQVRERTYRVYMQLSTYYMTRLCTIRFSTCDGTFEFCWPSSNELKVSEIRTDRKYGYDPYLDERVRNSCRYERHRSAKNGREERRHPSDDFLMIFGVILAINVIVFC